MIDFEKAKMIVLEELKKQEEYSKKYNAEPLNLQIIEKSTIEDDFGWVFFYNTKEHIETGDIYYALGGNAPIIVTRQEGGVYYTGTSYDVEYYIEEFKKKYYKK